jgi:nitrite reductase/ring-hydroxylating ferredoxin subunit
MVDDIRLMPIPVGLQAVGMADGLFEPVANVRDVPSGAMVRVTRGDFDLLIVHTPAGICVTDDRCPHMAAPLSLGTLVDCVVACPLHSGRFDLANGEVVQFPTTGGLDADGGYHPAWTPADASPKPEPTDLKARARALTRVRRLRYYPVRVVEGRIEVVFPR